MTDGHASAATKESLSVRERRTARTPTAEQHVPQMTEAQGRALTYATETYTDLVAALAGAGIYMPGLHIEHDDRSSDPQHTMVLGRVTMGSARKLGRILQAARP